MMPTYDQQIARLQRDKIIYAVESAATTLCMMLVIITLIATDMFPWDIVVPTALVLTSIAVIYWLYMGIGNAIRLKRVIDLQKQESKTK